MSIRMALEPISMAANIRLDGEFIACPEYFPIAKVLAAGMGIAVERKDPGPIPAPELIVYL